MGCKIDLVHNFENRRPIIGHGKHLRSLQGPGKSLLEFSRKVLEFSGKS